MGVLSISRELPSYREFSNFSNRRCYYTACKVNSQEVGVNFSNFVCLHNKEVP